MPNAPKQFRLGPSKQEQAKPTGRRKGSPSSRGYGSRWQRFRAWYFAYPCNVLCGCGCNRPAEELDHLEHVSGKDDERFFDVENVLGLTVACHARKTAAVDGSFGRGATAEGVKMLAAFKAEAKRRAAEMAR